MTDINAEEFARRLYFIRETLAPEYGQHPLPISFDELPSEAQKLLVATAHFVLEEMRGGPKCPHLRTILTRIEVRQCLDCGVYDPRHQERVA